MILSEEIKSLISHGDAVKITNANLGKVNYNTIRAALDKGECTDWVYEMIKVFYDDKKVRLVNPTDHEDAK